MASITTLNLATVAAGTDITNSQHAQKQAPPPSATNSPQQIQATSQAAVIFSKSDKERTPQAPKRVDAGFSPQDEQQKDGKAEKSKKKKGSSQGGSGPVDVVA